MKLVAFDLDDTLAPSKSPLPARMDVALRSLLDHVEVCIISGGQMGQFRTQVLDNLHATDEELSRLHLMPTCGTRYYRYEGGAWVERYAHDLDPEVAARAIDSLERHARELGLWESNPWGNIIEDRGSQITFSALGQEAPLDAKRAWDPDGTKKAALRSMFAAGARPRSTSPPVASTRRSAWASSSKRRASLLPRCSSLATAWIRKAMTTPSRPPATRRAPCPDGKNAWTSSTRSWHP